MAHRILAGSYTHEIYTLDFEPSTSSLSSVTATAVGHHPSWIALHPDDCSLVFAALEEHEGKVVAVKFEKNGKGTIVGESPSGGADPCSLFAATDELIISNYISGIVASLPISVQPPYIQGGELAIVQLSGSGPNKERQQSSHAHQVVLHPEREEWLMVDLGADKVWRFGKDDTGKWEIRGHVQYTPGSGPRHVALHDGMLYTLTELTNTVVAHLFPPLPSQPIFTHATSTLSHTCLHPEVMGAAEILVPNPNETYPEPYLYVSNRDDPSPEGDTIAIFSLADKEKPRLVGEVRTGLKHIRGIVFGGPDDKWLVAGGVKGGGVKVFERIEGGKNLRVVAENGDIKAPTAFLWV